MGYVYGDNYKDGNYVNRSKGWATVLGNILIPSEGKSNMLNRFKNELDNDFINSLSNEQLLALLDPYFVKDPSSSFLGNTSEVLDKEWFLKDLQQLQNVNSEVPELPDFDSVYKDAQNAIYAENDKLLDLLNQDMQRQTNAYQQGLNDLNSSYNNMFNQITSNNYQNNAMLMGTVGSEMSKARRNSLEAGASAGVRLAENVNTLLSIQNKQTQQSLETSNQLAQQLLNKQSAAAGIRGNYNNALSNNTNKQIGLQQGTEERVNSFANSKYNNAMQSYKEDLHKWETNYDSQTSGNNLAPAYKNYYKNKNQYGY